MKKKQIMPAGFWGWWKMMQRCYDPNHNSYKNYGGRGIRVCRRWHDYRNYLADMGPRPKGMTVERINNNGPYSPANCRWATWKEQHRNKRTNRILKAFGKSHPLCVWAEITGISHHTIISRINRGATVEQALTRKLLSRDHLK